MIYIKNFCYILRHKFWVGVYCIQIGLYKRAITHDLSKFSSHEFVPYARNFFCKTKDPFEVHCIKRYFRDAWWHHYKTNSHHPEFYKTCKLLLDENGNNKIEDYYIEMSKDNILEMIADLKAMSRTVGGNKDGKNPMDYIDWYFTKSDFNLNEYTRECLEWYFMVDKQCYIRGIK